MLAAGFEDEGRLALRDLPHGLYMLRRGEAMKVIVTGFEL